MFLTTALAALAVALLLDTRRAPKESYGGVLDWMTETATGYWWNHGGIRIHPDGHLTWFHTHLPARLVREDKPGLAWTLEPGDGPVEIPHGVYSVQIREDGQWRPLGRSTVRLGAYDGDASPGFSLVCTEPPHCYWEARTRHGIEPETVASLGGFHPVGQL